MAKVKSHAAWNGLSAEQRNKLAEWLFEEKLSYNVVLERARKELGFAGSRSSVRRFYERTAGERMLSGFEEVGKLAASVNSAPINLDGLRSSGMKVAAQVFLRLVTERPDEPGAWLPLARVLGQQEKNEAWRAVKNEENGIRQEALQFSRLRFQYDTVGAAMKLLPKLQKLKEAADEGEMTVYESNKRLNDVRRGMFGDAIPELLPENEEEEANPQIIVQRYHEALRRLHERYASQFEERKKEIELERARAAERGFIFPTAAPQANPAGKEEDAVEEQPGETEGAASASPGPEPAGEGKGFADEPRKLSADEKEREYGELMRRARGVRTRGGD